MAAFQSRARRFFELSREIPYGPMMPNMVQAGQYSSTVHYLPAVEAAGTDGAAAVMARMRNTPINDFFVKIGRIREDGRMIHDMYLFEVKKPSESKGAWDYCRLVTTIPADRAFTPPAQSRCPLPHAAR